MKRNFILTGIALCAVSCFTGCDDNDKKPSKNNIAGTWAIVDAVGVEWQENPGNTGAGTITNINDPDEDMIGETFVIEGSEITVFGDTYTFEYSDGVIVIDLGGEGESFNVEFDGSDTMIWTQDEPSAHSDYEENNPDQFLYYQKTFTLERQ
jgi:hypothetical protein